MVSGDLVDLDLDLTCFIIYFDKLSVQRTKKHIRGYWVLGIDNSNRKFIQNFSEVLGHQQAPDPCQTKENIRGERHKSSSIQPTQACAMSKLEETVLQGS